MRQAPSRAVLAASAALALAIGLAACGGARAPPATHAVTLPGRGNPPATLGIGRSSGELMLALLYKQALEAQGYTIALKTVPGSTATRNRAFLRGAIDFYLADIGDYAVLVAGERHIYPTYPDELATGRDYAFKHGSVMLAATHAVLGSRPTDPTHNFHTIAPIVSRALLEGQGQRFEQTLNAVSHAVTTVALRRITAAVTLHNQPQEAVVRAFLAAHRLT